MARNWELEAECGEYGESWGTDERKKPFGKNKHLWFNVWCRLTTINLLFPVLECLLEVSAHWKSNLITIYYLNIYLYSWLTFSVIFSIPVHFSGSKMLRWLAVWIVSSNSRKSQYIALSLHKIALLQMSKNSVEEPFKVHQLDSIWVKIHFWRKILSLHKFSTGSWSLAMFIVSSFPCMVFCWGLWLTFWPVTETCVGNLFVLSRGVPNGVCPMNSSESVIAVNLELISTDC